MVLAFNKDSLYSCYLEIGKGGDMGWKRNYIHRGECAGCIILLNRGFGEIQIGREKGQGRSEM